jgi:hypothetical protein
VEITNEHSELYQKPMEALPAKSKSLLKEYDSNNSEYSDLEGKYFYKQGFMDGVLFVMLSEKPG